MKATSVLRRRHLAILATAILAASACGSSTPVADPPAETPPVRTPSDQKPDPYELANRYQFDDPSDLARKLAEAETNIRSDRTDVRDLTCWALVQQSAYGKLVREPEWREEALDELPTRWRPTAARNVEAGENLLSLTPPQETLPVDWDIEAPPDPETLLRYYRTATEPYGISWEYLAAIHLAETRMSRIKGNSPKDAQGPMQFSKPTWDRFGEPGKIGDTKASIEAAAKLLAHYGAPRDMRRALGHYNIGDAYFRAITAYADVMKEDERAFYGYYHWQVFYRTEDGLALLYAGWPDDPIEPDVQCSGFEGA